jgi:hypothetical protein
MKTITILLMTGMLLTMNTYAESGTVIFEDKFEDKLADGWTWLRENGEDWRLTEEGLEIRPRPGDANSVQNALLLTLPALDDEDLSIEVTVTFTTELTQQYEQAGITWYADGAPAFKLVHERIDEEYFIIPGKVPAPEMTVHLHLELRGNKYVAKFRQDSEKEFRIAAEGELNRGAKNQVSLQCYHGPDQGDHWMRFSNFKITKARP